MEVRKWRNKEQPRQIAGKKLNKEQSNRKTGKQKYRLDKRKRNGKPERRQICKRIDTFLYHSLVVFCIKEI